jgi:hypothetical protein
MLIIDRFEGEYAICECDDGNMIQIRRDLIAADAREGDVLIPGQNALYRRCRGHIGTQAAHSGKDRSALLQRAPLNYIEKQQYSNCGRKRT